MMYSSFEAVLDSAASSLDGELVLVITRNKKESNLSSDAYRTAGWARVSIVMRLIGYTCGESIPHI
jgi:hypothetical protein